MKMILAALVLLVSNEAHAYSFYTSELPALDEETRLACNEFQLSEEAEIVRWWQAAGDRTKDVLYGWLTRVGRGLDVDRSRQFFFAGASKVCPYKGYILAKVLLASIPASLTWERAYADTRVTILWKEDVDLRDQAREVTDELSWEKARYETLDKESTESGAKLQNAIGGAIFEYLMAKKPFPEEHVELFRSCLNAFKAGSDADAKCKDLGTVPEVMAWFEEQKKMSEKELQKELPKEFKALFAVGYLTDFDWDLEWDIHEAPIRCLWWIPEGRPSNPCKILAAEVRKSERRVKKGESPWDKLREARKLLEKIPDSELKVLAVEHVKAVEDTLAAQLKYNKAHNRAAIRLRADSAILLDP